MLVVIGLILLLAAIIVGVAGAVSNAGAAHLLTDDFAVFGYHVTGSTGSLLLYGILIGAVGAIGLATLLAGARRAASRGREARRELKRVRQDTPAAEPAVAPHPLGDHTPNATTEQPTGRRRWFGGSRRSRTHDGVDMTLQAPTAER